MNAIATALTSQRQAARRETARRCAAMAIEIGMKYAETAVARFGLSDQRTKEARSKKADGQMTVVAQEIADAIRTEFGLTEGTDG